MPSSGQTPCATFAGWRHPLARRRATQRYWAVSLPVAMSKPSRRGETSRAMVLQVCWRILATGPMRKTLFRQHFWSWPARPARPAPRALPAWLHGVARAWRQGTGGSNPPPRDRNAAAGPADGRADPLTEISARELLTIIDEEVQRLPEQYRLPVILRCLGGRSLEEAARQLGGLMAPSRRLNEAAAAA